MKNFFEEIDEMINFPIVMNEANEKIEIHDGEFILKNENEEFKINGNVSFVWFPNKGVVFKGVIEDNEQIKLIRLRHEYNLILNDFDCGKVFITKHIMGVDYQIVGRSISDFIVGDKSIAVEKIKFSLPNFKDYQGDIIKKTLSNGYSTCHGRLILENDKYIITIDKLHNLKDLKDSVEEKGGYIITHVGEIIPKKRNIEYLESIDLLNCLNNFLSFLNGKRVSALFTHGIYEDDKIWVDYSSKKIDTNEASVNWWNSSDIFNTQNLWSEFYKLWIINSETLNTAIHWYLQCNNRVGYIEGSLIMAQTALELLYNWYIVENKKLIIGNDSENINAANKIRLLISQLNINTDIPQVFIELENYRVSENLIDGPNSIVQIRNAIVHSQEEKRKKLNQIDDYAKLQALYLSIWYMELSILKLLNFEGKYHNRTGSNNNDYYENVPWLQ